MKIKKIIISLSLIFLFIISFSIQTKADTITIDMSSIRWSNNSFVYDGLKKTMYLENFPSDFPSDIAFSYTGAEAIECGLYKAKVKVTYDKDKYHLVNIKYQDEKDWQIRQKSITDVTGTITITADYGIHPNQTVVYEEFDIDLYANVDVTIAGAYQEVKKAFTISIMEDGRTTMPDGVIVVQFYVPGELLYVEQLMIYDYGMNRLNSLDSREKNGVITFTTHHLSDTYLLVGMRSTYTNNQIWKAFLIFTVTGVGITGIVIAIRVRKRKQDEITLDKELYTRSKLR